MRTKNLARATALLVGLALVGAACGDDDGGGAAATTTAGETTTTAGDTTTTAGDTTTTAGGGGDTAGALEGMKGTLPLVDLSDDFKDRMLEVDPELKDFNYGAETYDSVIVIALAVAKAGTDGIEYASEINGITRGGEKCTSFQACLDIIEAGGDPDYDGVSGPLEFSGNGEPTQASFGVQQFGSDNRIDDSLTEFRVINAPSSADVDQVPVEGTRAGDGVLTIGSILPQTGSLAFLGPPEFAGFDLAINEINEAGGVLGQQVVGIKGDSGDATTDTANQTVDRLLAQNVDAIVGAASSGVSLTVIDKITGAGVVQFSPANTSKRFSTYDDKGLYFRAAPSDILQGAVLGSIIAEDGHATVGMIVRNDAYGTGLQEDTKAALEEAGVEVVVERVYDEKATSFDSEVAAVKAANPDAIVLITFEEGSRILKTMVEQGIGPRDTAVYGCDGNMGNALGADFDAGK
jgi:ABC-type branched-subunit amino acid transport system substrate-binding protein